MAGGGPAAAGAAVVRYAAFNQDASCVSVASDAGIRVFSTATGECRYADDAGATALAEVRPCVFCCCTRTASE